MRRQLSVLIVLLGLVWLLPVQAQDEVHEYRLDNGLKLLVKVDPRAPVVVSQVWYKVGASSEYGGITGISHVLEHMMFKGTQAHPPGEFSRIIKAHGGRENAFTGPDYTAYFQELERSRLPISFELEADRMRNLTLPPEEFAKEVQVVMEERRLRTEDNPRALTYERFKATAFLASPYQNPVIGWMNDLENLTVDDLREWYRLWYAPNNATVVVAGDVDPDAVFALAQRHFGPLQAASDLRPPKPRQEPEQRGERRVVVKAPAELPYLLMGYKVPVLNTATQNWEPYALEVLAGILDGGGSARLSRELVRGSQIVASAGAGYPLYSRLDDLFLLDATPAAGHSVEEVEQALREQVARLRREPVQSAELERVKAQVVAANIYQKDSVFYQGMELGRLETVGLGWERAAAYVDKVRAVTAEQVQAVAQRYLIDAHLTVAVLDPQPIGRDAAARPSAGAVGHSR